MKRSIGFLLTLVVFTIISGCGQRLNGVYEMIPEIPRMPMPKGTDPKLQRQLDDMARNTQAMARMTLEFDGSTVKMRAMSVETEYKYRIKGQSLEVLVEAMGQKSTILMNIESDGTINHMGMIYRKVR